MQSGRCTFARWDKIIGQAKTPKVPVDARAPDTEAVLGFAVG